jgi:hypothetical protein
MQRGSVVVMEVDVKVEVDVEVALLRTNRWVAVVDVAAGLYRRHVNPVDGRLPSISPVQMSQWP